MPLLESIDEITRKNTSRINDMSAVDVVLSPGTRRFLRLINISLPFYCCFFLLLSPDIERHTATVATSISMRVV